MKFQFANEKDGRDDSIEISEEQNSTYKQIFRAMCLMNEDNNNNNFGTNTRNRARPRTYSKLWSA